MGWAWKYSLKFLVMEFHMHYKRIVLRATSIRMEMLKNSTCQFLFLSLIHCLLSLRKCEVICSKSDVCAPCDLLPYMTEISMQFT